MSERMIVSGGVALSTLMLLLAVGLGLTVPGGLVVPADAAVAAAQGGACSQTTDCSQSSYCYNTGLGASIYFQYQGGGVRWYDDGGNYGLGKCRISTIYSGNGCGGTGSLRDTWWVCS